MLLDTKSQHVSFPTFSCNLWKCTVTSGVKDLCVQQSSLHQTACIYLEKEVHESCHSELEMNMCILVDDWDICKELPMEFVLRTLAGKLTAAFHYNSNWCWCTIPDQEEPIIDTYNQGLQCWTSVYSTIGICQLVLFRWKRESVHTSDHNYICGAPRWAQCNTPVQWTSPMSLELLTDVINSNRNGGALEYIKQEWRCCLLKKWLSWAPNKASAHWIASVLQDPGSLNKDRTPMCPQWWITSWWVAPITQQAMVVRHGMELLGMNTSVVECKFCRALLSLSGYWTVKARLLLTDLSLPGVFSHTNWELLGSIQLLLECIWAVGESTQVLSSSQGTLTWSSFVPYMCALKKKSSVSLWNS